MISDSLRRTVFSGVRKKARDNCMVMVGSTLLVALVGDVDPEGFGEPHEVDAAMLEEAAIFNGGDGVDQDFRDVVVLDELALGAVGVEKGSDQLRLEFVAGKFGATAGDDSQSCRRES